MSFKETAVNRSFICSFSETLILTGGGRCVWEGGVLEPVQVLIGRTAERLAAQL